MKEITVKFIVPDWQIKQLQEIGAELDHKQKYGSKHTVDEVFDMIMTAGSIYTIADKINSWASLLLLTRRMTAGEIDAEVKNMLETYSFNSSDVIEEPRFSMDPGEPGCAKENNADDHIDKK